MTNKNQKPKDMDMDMDSNPFREMAAFLPFIQLAAAGIQNKMKPKEVVEYFKETMHEFMTQMDEFDDDMDE